MQMQEDEIQLLKMALADVLKRLNISEEHQAAAAGGRRTSGAKGETRSGWGLKPFALRKIVVFVLLSSFCCHTITNGITIDSSF